MQKRRKQEGKVIRRGKYEESKIQEIKNEIKRKIKRKVGN